MIVAVPLVSAVSLAIAMVRVQPSTVFRETLEPEIALIVIPPNPCPPNPWPPKPPMSPSPGPRPWRSAAVEVAPLAAARVPAGVAVVPKMRSAAPTMPAASAPRIPILATEDGRAATSVVGVV